jgi:hypothetical protein
MSTVYVVKNQHGFFASKQKEWVDGREPKLLFRSAHKDEAINMIFELSSKDIEVRAETLTVELATNKHPVVEVTVPLVIKVDPETELDLSAQADEGSVHHPDQNDALLTSQVEPT